VRNLVVVLLRNEAHQDGLESYLNLVLAKNCTTRDMSEEKEREEKENNGSNSRNLLMV